MLFKSFNSYFQIVKQNSLNVKEKKLSKIAFSHVGCEKNLVDTEHMQGLLNREGYEVDSNINDANVVVVNTCSFIETARQESIRKILEYTNQGKEVIVAGCMAQHFKDELIKEKKLSKVAFSHVGCEKNLVDTEHMQGLLLSLIHI